jgi:hypothetical protein
MDPDFRQDDEQGVISYAIALGCNRTRHGQDRMAMAAGTCSHAGKLIHGELDG